MSGFAMSPYRQFSATAALQTLRWGSFWYITRLNREILKLLPTIMNRKRDSLAEARLTQSQRAV